MRLAIIGSRSFTNWSYAAAIIKPFIDINHITSIVSGGAKGADHIAELAAEAYNLPIKVFKPDWKLGRGAGMIRNNSIISSCDIALVFWDYASKGTRDSINKLAKSRIPTMIVNINSGEFEWFNGK